MRGRPFRETEANAVLGITPAGAGQTHGNEYGGITGGQGGDQTGREVSIVSFYDYPWTHVLIPPEDDGSAPPQASNPEPNAPSGGFSGSAKAYIAHLPNVGWLAEVTRVDDTDDGYAGIKGRPMDMIGVAGSSEYRVHYLGGDWEVPVYGYDINDTVNGLAGDFGRLIDGVAIKGRPCRVHTREDGWLEWVDTYDITDSVYGVAGIYGHAIDGLQVA